MLVFLFVSMTLFAQETDKKKRRDPIQCFEKEAKQLGKILSTEHIEKLIQHFRENRPLNRWLSIIEIKEYIEPLKDKNAYSFCIIAELMKRVGDYQAEDYYKKAIGASPDEPAYELFYADYLRNFRGAQRPLFPEAEEHYYKALKKLEELKQKKHRKAFDVETQRRVERGLIALYQQDGLPLLCWKSDIIEPKRVLERPFVFFSTIDKYAKQTTDFDEVDDVRDFTSEALFASSKMRLNRALTEDELKNVIRSKKQCETLNRLRFRYRYRPALDIFYRYREIDDAQITNFFEPNKYNDVNLNEYGMAIEKPLGFSQYFDLFLKGTFKRTKREGIIEFLPDTKEDINHFEAKTALSRFFGPNKANLELTYVFQDIDPDIANPPKRDRQIFASTLVLLRPLYELRFETRGLEIFGGIVHDKEKFGHVDVRKNDYFVGASLKGFELSEQLNTFDVTIQPTIFTSEVEGDKSQDNSQYRTNFTLLYRICDEEKVPGIPKKVMGTYPAFLHLAIAIRHDIAIDGPKDFESFKAGIELNTKFFIRSFGETKVFGTTFLASLGYYYQHFHRLDRDLNLFSFNISMGF